MIPVIIEYNLEKVARRQKEGLKRPEDIYKASLQSTINSDQHFLRSLSSDKNLLLIIL